MAMPAFQVQTGHMARGEEQQCTWGGAWVARMGGARDEGVPASCWSPLGLPSMQQHRTCCFTMLPGKNTSCAATDRYCLRRPPLYCIVLQVKESLGTYAKALKQDNKTAAELAESVLRAVAEKAVVTEGGKPVDLKVGWYVGGGRSCCGALGSCGGAAW